MADLNDTVVLLKDYSTSVVDYIVMVAVLLVSLGIGIFYSYKQKTSEDYLHGGRQMALIPVSISLVVSFISAITMQGMPAEVYMYGIDIICEAFGIWGVFLVIVTFVPIYFKLKPTTVFQYLEKRFQSNIPRLLGSVLSGLSMIGYAGVVTYGPAVALESLMGTPTIYNIMIMSVICTVYTSIGGIKAVVWTDVLQAGIMVAGLVVVLIHGLARLGLTTIIEEISKSGRGHISLNPKLTQRYNMWMGMVSNGIFTFCVFTTQVAMVRFTGLPTLRQAKISVGIGGISYFASTTLALAVGAVVFAHYSHLGCGPLEAGVISTPNQIAPYYVMTELNYPGLPGLFISSILASSLSTISSVQNGLAAMVWKDLLGPCLPNISEFRKTLLLKVIAAAVGIIITVMAVGFMLMSGTLLEVTASTLSTISAPMGGIFVLGAFFPWVGINLCALLQAGLISWACSTGFCMWISLGKLIHGPHWDKPDLVYDKCPTPPGANVSEIYTTPSAEYWTQTQVMDTVQSHSTFPLYSISHYSYYSFGVSITVIVGVILSVLPVFRQKEPFDPALVVSFMRRYVPIMESSHDSKDIRHPDNIEPLMGSKTEA